MRLELGFGTWSYALMTVSLVAFTVFVVVGIFVLIHYHRRSVGFDATVALADDYAERLLARELARGKIDLDAYVTIMDVLHGKRPPKRPAP